MMYTLRLFLLVPNMTVEATNKEKESGAIPDPAGPSIIARGKTVSNPLLGPKNGGYQEKEKSANPSSSEGRAIVSFLLLAPITPKEGKGESKH